MQWRLMQRVEYCCLPWDESPSLQRAAAPPALLSTECDGKEAEPGRRWVTECKYPPANRINATAQFFRAVQADPSLIKVDCAGLGWLGGQAMHTQPLRLGISISRGAFLCVWRSDMKDASRRAREEWAAVAAAAAPVACPLPLALLHPSLFSLDTLAPQAKWIYMAETDFLFVKPVVAPGPAEGAAPALGFFYPNVFPEYPQWKVRPGLVLEGAC